MKKNKISPPKIFKLVLINISVNTLNTQML